MWKYCENIMIKIDTNFNLNVLLKLFFSLSKKIIFFSPILANNNLPLKIYCENIVIAFPSFFSFFPPLFLSSTHVPHFFFSFFLLHTHTLTLSSSFFSLLSSLCLIFSKKYRTKQKTKDGLLSLVIWSSMWQTKKDCSKEKKLRGCLVE